MSKNLVLVLSDTASGVSAWFDFKATALEEIDSEIFKNSGEWIVNVIGHLNYLASNKEDGNDSPANIRVSLY